MAVFPHTPFLISHNNDFTHAHAPIHCFFGAAFQPQLLKQTVYTIVEHLSYLVDYPRISACGKVRELSGT